MSHLDIVSEGQHTFRLKALIDALLFFALPTAILIASGAERRIAYPILVALCALYFYAREHLPRRSEPVSGVEMARWGTRTLAPRMALLALLLYFVFWLTQLNGLNGFVTPLQIRWEYIGLAAAIGAWMLERANARALRKDYEELMHVYERQIMRLEQDRDRIGGKLATEQKK